MRTAHLHELPICLDCGAEHGPWADCVPLGRPALLKDRAAYMRQLRAHQEDPEHNPEPKRTSLPPRPVAPIPPAHAVPGARFRFAPRSTVPIFAGIFPDQPNRGAGNP